MDSAYTSRQPRFRLVLVVIAMLAAPAIAVGCGGKVAVDRDGVSGSGGSGGSGSGGGGGSGGTGAGSSSGGDAGCNFTTSSEGTQMHLPTCFTVPDDGCPSQYDAPLYIFPSSNCVYLVSVDCGPKAVSDQCCYMITEEMQPCSL